MLVLVTSAFVYHDLQPTVCYSRQPPCMAEIATSPQGRAIRPGGFVGGGNQVPSTKGASFWAQLFEALLKHAVFPGLCRVLPSTCHVLLAFLNLNNDDLIPSSG